MAALRILIAIGALVFASTAFAGEISEPAPNESSTTSVPAQSSGQPDQNSSSSSVPTATGATAGAGLPQFPGSPDTDCPIDPSNPGGAQDKPCHPPQRQ